jgi:MFS family permease
MKGRFGVSRLHKAALNVSVITALSLFGDSLLYPILPLYAQQLGVPLVMVGVLLSINRWVRLLSNHTAARSFSRHSVYLPIVLAAVGATVSTGMYAFPIGILGFLVARMLWGVSFSHFRMGMYLIVLQTSQPVLGWALGLTRAISRVGSTLIAIVGGYFVDRLGYHWTMLVLAVLTAIAIPLAFLLKHQLPSGSLEQDPKILAVPEIVTKLAGPTPLSTEFCCVGAFITHLVGSGLVTSSLSLLLQQTIGEGLRLGSSLTLGVATVSGLVFSSNWLSAILLSSSAGRLSDLYGRTVPFVAATALQGIALFSVATTPSPWLAVISSVCFFVLTNIQRVFLDAALGDTTNRDNRNVTTAKYNSYQDFGAALGPLIGYAAFSLSGFSQVYIIGALLLILTASVPLVSMLRKPSPMAS